MQVDEIKSGIVRSFKTTGVESMDRFTSMTIFVRVVELGGFAPTANEAGLSPTMVAKHVSALEARLGARLLNRTTRRQSLTEAGQMYFERCKSLLADMNEADASVSTLRSSPKGVLKITAPASFGSHRLVPALQKFMRAYPDIRVELALSERIVNMVDEGYEAAFRIGALADSQLIARPLAPYQSLLAAAPAYLRMRGAPRSPQELLAHDCLGFSAAGGRSRWRLSDGMREEVVNVVPRLRSNNGEALRQAALAGMGITLQPEVLLADDIQHGRLVHVLPHWAPLPRKMHLVYLNDRQPTAKLKCFLDFAISEFGAN